jgi:hypothetical protein
MGRPGAARKARIARKDMINKATPTWSTAPPADKAVAIKKPRGRPPKNKRSPHQSVNELCVEDGDGYAAEGTHTHLSLSRRPLIFCVLQLAPPPRRRPRRPSPHHRPVCTICRGAQFNYDVLAGSVDDALDVYVENETPSTLDTVVKNILKKVPCCLAHGIAMQLLEQIIKQYEQDAMEAEDASMLAEEKATKNAWKMIAAAVDAASPGN